MEYTLLAKTPDIFQTVTFSEREKANEDTLSVLKIDRNLSSVFGNIRFDNFMNNPFTLRKN